MKTAIEQQKQAMKEKMSHSIDDFFTEWERMINVNEGMNINEIERMWGEGIDRSSKLYNDVIKGLSGVQTEKESKKNAVRTVGES